jgi:hypothetical protein
MLGETQNIYNCCSEAPFKASSFIHTSVRGQTLSRGRQTYSLLLLSGINLSSVGGLFCPGHVAVVGQAAIGDNRSHPPNGIP